MKTRSFCKVTLSAAVLAAALIFETAHADEVSTQSREWAGTVRAAVKGRDVVLGAIDLTTNTIPADVRTRLQAIAEDQAQIWADTILEGDYIAQEEVALDSVETVSANSIFLGYRITYSSLAAETSDCNPEANITACVQGKIVESTFVAPTLDAWIRDAKHLAEFVAN